MINFANMVDFCTNPQAPPSSTLGAVYYSNLFCMRPHIDWGMAFKPKLTPSAIMQFIPVQDPSIDYSAFNCQGKPHYPGGNSTTRLRYGGFTFQQLTPIAIARWEPSWVMADDYACNPQSLPSNHVTPVCVGVDYNCNPHMARVSTQAPIAWSNTDLQQNPQGSLRTSGWHVVCPSPTATQTQTICQNYDASQSPVGLGSQLFNATPAFFTIKKSGRTKDGRLARYWDNTENGNTRQPLQKRGANQLHSELKSQSSTDATAATVTKKQDRPVSGGVDYLGKPLLLPSEPHLDSYF